jgi:acyl dehydratase
MTRPPVSLRFARLPSALRYYPRAVLARRKPSLPPGESIPRLEGAVEGIAVQPRHLARYRAVCGFGGDASLLPATYPHVLAMPLHMALMTHPSFVVRLMGLVHIANEIEWLRPLPVQGRYGLRAWLEGHRDCDRGQEFDLHTELADDKGVAWRERSTLLARQRGSGAQAARSARAALRQPKPLPGQPVADIPIAAGREIGRRYGRVSDDLNPIHIADWGARLFGFEHAVAHGMWSMARSLAALGPDLTPPCSVSVEFKLPLFLGSRARLHHWRGDDAWTFVLQACEGQRPHLAGSVTRPA